MKIVTATAAAWLLWMPSMARAQTPAPVVPANDALASVPLDYRLDIGDTIRIAVMRHDVVGGNFLVPPDGLLRLTRVETPINARGKTCPDLVKEVSHLLTTEGKLRLRPNAVTVAVVAPRLRRVYVRGSAIRTADIDLRPDLTIAQLITLVGMPSLPVDRTSALLTNPKRPVPIPINLDAALNTPGSPDNVALLEGDTLSVDAPRTVRLLVEGEGPRGQHEIDHRYGLRRALAQLAYTTTGATGSLKDALLVRKRVPGDLNSDDEIIPINLLTLMKPDTRDVPLRDMDLLYIPPSERYVYVFGEVGGARKQMMPEDRKTYLVDVIAAAGGPFASAKIGKIGLIRNVDGKEEKRVVDFGDYLKTQNPAHNPEILPHDLVYVPKVGTRIGVGEFFTGISLWNVFRSLAGR